MDDNKAIESLDENKSLVSQLFSIDLKLPTIMEGGGKKEKPKVVNPPNESPKPKPSPFEKHAHPPHDEPVHAKPKAAPVTTKEGESDELEFLVFGGKKTIKQKGRGQEVEILPMFDKIVWIYLWVFLTVFISFYVISLPFWEQFAIIVTRFPEDDKDFKSAKGSHSSRIRFIAFYCFLYLLIMFIVGGLLLGVFYMYIQIKYDKEISAGMKASEIFKKAMFKFNSYGQEEDMVEIYFALVIILIFGFAVYLIYFQFVKTHFEGLRYPNYVNYQKHPERIEYSQTRKFILNYGMSILFLFAFAIMMINYSYGRHTKVAFIWNVVVLMLLLLFSGLTIKFNLSKNLWQLLHLFLLIMVVVILQPQGKAVVNGIYKMISRLQMVKRA